MAAIAHHAAIAIVPPEAAVVPDRVRVLQVS